MLAEPGIYILTEHRNYSHRGIMNYIDRGATMNLALGALAPHTIGTPSLDTPEPTRDLAESRDPYIEDTESRIQNREGHHRHHVTAEPPLIPILEPRLDLAVGHILSDI